MHLIPRFCRSYIHTNLMEVLLVMMKQPWV